MRARPQTGTDFVSARSRCSLPLRSLELDVGLETFKPEPPHLQQQCTDDVAPYSIFELVWHSRQASDQAARFTQKVNGNAGDTLEKSADYPDGAETLFGKIELEVPPPKSEPSVVVSKAFDKAGSGVFAFEIGDITRIGQPDSGDEQHPFLKRFQAYRTGPDIARGAQRPSNADF
jgi:hypothetical protein